MSPTIPPSASLPAGTVVAGRYQIVRPLGEGGMGAVYEAVQLPLGRRCALKTLLPQLARDPQSVARFEREARAAAALGHPNIVQVTDFLWEGGIPVLVMELLEGQSLGSLLRREGRIAPGRAAFIASQVLLALDVAHRAGIVHRDVKPDNVFLTSISGMQDIVKVLDWGIAKLDAGGPTTGDRPATELTQAGSMLGSPAYMSPEQARGTQVDHRADIYGVGATMYRAIGGRLPFEATTINALLFAIAEQEAQPLSQFAQTDPALSAIVSRAMAKAPTARFQSAAEMNAALQPLVAAGRANPLVVPTPGSPTLTNTGGPPLGTPPPGTTTTGGPPRGTPPPGMGPSGPPPGLAGPAAQPPMIVGPQHAATGVAPPMQQTQASATQPPRAPARSSSAALWAIFAVLVLILLLGGGAGGLYFWRAQVAASAVASASTTPSTPDSGKGTSTTPSASSASSVTPTSSASTVTVASATGSAAGVAVPRDAGALPTTPTTPTTPTAPTPTGPTPTASRDAGGPPANLAGGPTGEWSGCSCNDYSIDNVRAALAKNQAALNACYAKNQYDGVDHQFQIYHLEADRSGRVTSASAKTMYAGRCTAIDACVVPILRTMNIGPAEKNNGGGVDLSLRSRKPNNP